MLIDILFVLVVSGKSASPDQIARVLYLVSRFRAVEEIPSVEVSRRPNAVSRQLTLSLYFQCYHIGDDLIVECDVILPKDTSMAHAHDIGETIQCCLERCVAEPVLLVASCSSALNSLPLVCSLDHVARAYVHVDYNSENPYVFILSSACYCRSLTTSTRDSYSAQHTSRPAKNGGLRVTSSPSNTTPSTPTVVQSPSGGAGEADGKSKA